MKIVAPAGLPPYWPRTGKKSIGSDGGGAASLDATLALYLMLFREVFSRVEKVGVVKLEDMRLEGRAKSEGCQAFDYDDICLCI